MNVPQRPLHPGETPEFLLLRRVEAALSEIIEYDLDPPCGDHYDGPCDHYEVIHDLAGPLKALRGDVRDRLTTILLLHSRSRGASG